MSSSAGVLQSKSARRRRAQPAALAAGSCVVGVPWRLVSCIGSAFADATRTERSGCEERTEKKTDRGDGIDRCDRPDRALDRAARFRGYPKAVRTDQGPEFTNRALDQWAYANGVTLKLIQAGKPTQNAYIESFNGKFRDECLDEHWFTTLAHARAVSAAWRQDYNEQRPHSALNYLAPSEFAAKHRTTADAPAAFQELV